MDQIDILAVAHAPLTAINRRFYREMVRRGWSVELVIPQFFPGSDRPAEPDEPDDPKIHRLTFVGEHPRFRRFDGLAEVFSKTSPRIVYMEGEPDTRLAWEIGGLCQSTGSHLVCNSNENDLPPVFEALFEGKVKPAIRSLRSQIWCQVAKHRVAYVFSICDDGTEAMERMGFQGKVSKIPLGFDKSLFTPSAGLREKVRSDLNLNGPTIAYFGRLTRIKGVHDLIRALAQISDLDWQFLIDEFESELDQYGAEIEGLIEAHGLADRVVRFTSNHVDMPGFMNAADIAVVPSIWKEQYGRVVPEAMAMGCLTIVSNCGAMPELLGETGLVFPGGDVDALARMLRDVLNNPGKFEHLNPLAAARAAQHLSIDAQCDAVEPVLKNLLGQS